MHYSFWYAVEWCARNNQKIIMNNTTYKLVYALLAPIQQAYYYGKGIHEYIDICEQGALAGLEYAKEQGWTTMLPDEWNAWIANYIVNGYMKCDWDISREACDLLGETQYQLSTPQKQL